MLKYKNLGGSSGVTEFEIREESILVKFRNNPEKNKPASTYNYAKQTIGIKHLEKMKILASEGRGLNAYINNNRDVRDYYEYSETQGIKKYNNRVKLAS